MLFLTLNYAILGVLAFIPSIIFLSVKLKMSETSYLKAIPKKAKIKSTFLHFFTKKH
jgi:hypothetical protein